MSARLISALMGVVLLASCARQSEHSESAGRDFVVDTLFTKDGCTVYRFYDHGNARYFTNCSGSTEWRESHGKGQTRQIGISGGAQ